MKLILDARILTLYPVGKPGFSGGTENMVRVLAHGLAEKGHTVHVVTPDLESEEHRGEREWWWTPRAFPTSADAAIAIHDAPGLEQFDARTYVLATNGIDPGLGDGHRLAEAIDLFPVFSAVHADWLCKVRPTVAPERCVVTGLGVDLPPLEDRHVPGRLLYGNDPARGLWHVLDVYDHLKRLVPHATLHVSYDFERQFQHHRWAATALAEELWMCRQRLQTTPGVRSLGGLSAAETRAEQAACHVHAMPSDPPNMGSQIHGLMQMECAAAGVPLVLSDTEAFPEVFGPAAEILPVPGTYLPEVERRITAQDWAEVVADLMLDPVAWADASRKARALAAGHTWAHVIERWDAMLQGAA